MRILVTNDDGIDSEGIAALSVALADIGHDVLVVAPDRNMSGMSAALGPVEIGAGVERIRVRRVDLDGIDGWAVPAPPSLGVFAAAQGGFGTIPDLVVSGVNLGLNTGRSVLHSGTVGAALTAATFGIPALAASLAAGRPCAWDTACAVALRGLDWVLRHPGNKGAVLNLNVPNRPLGELRGLRWAELDLYGAVQTVGQDPEHGLTFELRSADRPAEPGSDLALVEAGFATASLLCPVAALDPTDLHPLEGPRAVTASPQPPPEHHDRKVR